MGMSHPQSLIRKRRHPPHTSFWSVFFFTPNQIDKREGGMEGGRERAREGNLFMTEPVVQLSNMAKPEIRGLKSH